MENILIVDDSVMIRRILRTFFENSGHNVVAEASNGYEAIVKYKKFIPDLVTMDLIMPQLNGLDSVKEIVALYPDAKIIVLSSINKKEMVVNALQSGAKAYVLKPIDETKMSQEVERILGS